ncbi:MAG: hypothetical protein ABEI07_01270 [Candidatus Nanohaloarchaea archaeon]
MRALLSEIERNLDLAGSTKRMVDRDRDMLQGNLEERLVLHRFHTDAWDALVRQGSVQELGEAEDTLSRCYMELKEFNEVIDRFNQHGNRIVYIPSLENELGGYGRKELLEILREKSDEAEIILREARKELKPMDL